MRVWIFQHWQAFGLTAKQFFFKHVCSRDIRSMQQMKNFAGNLNTEAAFPIEEIPFKFGFDGGGNSQESRSESSDNSFCWTDSAQFQLSDNAVNYIKVVNEKLVSAWEKCMDTPSSGLNISWAADADPRQVSIFFQFNRMAIGGATVRATLAVDNLDCKDMPSGTIDIDHRRILNCTKIVPEKTAMFTIHPVDGSDTSVSIPGTPSNDWVPIGDISGSCRAVKETDTGAWYDLTFTQTGRDVKMSLNTRSHSHSGVGAFISPDTIAVKLIRVCNTACGGAPKGCSLTADFKLNVTSSAGGKARVSGNGAVNGIAGEPLCDLYGGYVFDPVCSPNP